MITFTTPETAFSRSISGLNVAATSESGWIIVLSVNPFSKNPSIWGANSSAAFAPRPAPTMIGVNWFGDFSDFSIA